MLPFIVYSLPRSRTAWLAGFLTYREWTCYHEQATYMRSLDDVKQFFAKPRIGTVETAAAQGWWLIHHYVPDIRAVVIRRPVDDVVKSMLEVDISGVATYDESKLYKLMTYGDRMLTKIIESLDVLVLDYDDLATREGCRAVFEYCLPYAFDDAWWNTMKDRNIQVDMKAFLSWYAANREAVEGFKRLCYAELRRIYPAAIKMRG